MIKFRNITENDRQLIQSIVMQGDNRSCDLSYSNLVAWRFRFGTQFSIVDDFLLVKFFHGDTQTYLMPAYSRQTAADERFADRVENVIRLMREDAIAMGHPPLLIGSDTVITDIIRQRFSDFFTIEERRDFADYIYLREKLVTLSGKKLQGKRNHINKFKATYPDYTYRDLTEDLLPLCVRLEMQWRKRRQSTGEGESMMYELRAMTRSMRRWEKLQLVGGTLWVDGNLVAFTYGCPLTDDTFDVLVEKADSDYEGAYQMINQEFVKRLPEKYTYINREDDMGLEGLRKAKLSYRPEILLMKYAVTESKPPGEFASPDRIKDETRALWHRTFQDSEAFEKLYFTKVFRHEYNCFTIIGNKVVGAVQTLPYTLLYHGEEAPISYVSGTSVDENCRKEGIGRNIMLQALRKMKCAKKVFAALIPAEEWLYRWYGEMGFVQQITCTPPLADVVSTPFERLDSLQRAKDCIVLHDEEQWKILQEERLLTGSQPIEKPIAGMIRVIDAEQALALYARIHPELEEILHVNDEQLEQNDAFYIIRSGNVIRTDKPHVEARYITIAQLADMILGDEKLEMSAMLNEG